MSNIGSSMLGVVPGQAQSKGKAGSGVSSGGAFEKGQDFASAIASFGDKAAGGDRRNARLSISAGLAEQGTDAGEKIKLSRNALSTGEGLARKQAADTASLPGATQQAAGKESVDDVATDFLDAVAMKLEKRPAAAEGREPIAADEATGDVPPDSGETPDVGQLLTLLAASDGTEIVTAPVQQAASSALGQGGKDSKDGKAATRSEAAAKLPSGEGAASEDAAIDGGDIPEADTDRPFRLVRSDGKGREVDMTLSGNGDRATFRDAAATGAKGEAVTVVESRRYIGLAQAGNSAAVTAAITQDPEWASSLTSSSAANASEAAATGKVVNTLKIRMNPIELGMVTATLRLSGDALVVSLQVETAEAYRQLSDDQDGIVKALRAQGFAVDQVNIQFSPADRNASANQQGDAQAQQFSNQQQAREGGDGRQGSERQQVSEPDNPGREGTSHEGNVAQRDIGSGTQPLRPDSVYL